MQRYGGTVDKFTGDGIMAVFGAPVALEDHAVRACLAAQGIQEEGARLAVAVKDRDGLNLQLRVGLNSGQVIAGEIGSGAFGYTAIGEQVGMAQRMESVAPPGGVMLSESTARLVANTAALGEPEFVHIKGADVPVPARLLLGMNVQHGSIRRAESQLGTWAQLATLALALVCFGLGERLHGSGFVTAFVGGLAYAVVSRRSGTQAAATQVSDAAGQLLELLVFALFGAVAVVPAWRHAGWRVVVFAALALIVVRIASLAIALAGSGLPRRSKLFMGWFGPRGIGTLVLGLIVIQEGEIQQGTLITQAVVVIVTLSLVLHSLTAAPGIRLCQQEDDTPTDSPPERRITV